jgi:hypothetical protein
MLEEKKAAALQSKDIEGKKSYIHYSIMQELL